MEILNQYSITKLKADLRLARSASYPLHLSVSLAVFQLPKRAFHADFVNSLETRHAAESQQATGLAAQVVGQDSLP